MFTKQIVVRYMLVEYNKKGLAHTGKGRGNDKCVLMTQYIKIIIVY